MCEAVLSEEEQAEQEQAEQEKNAVALLKHIKELAVLKYDSEEKREQSLIQQSSQMQTVFSFVTAVIFMALPVILQYCLNLSALFFLLSVSSVMLFLLISFITSSLAQWRWKTRAFPDITDSYTFVSDDWENSMKESVQLKQYIELLKDVQIAKAELNKRRVVFIMTSMVCFYISLGLVMLWFFIGIGKIL